MGDGRAGEISITRKVFRNGESEYFINDASCRLKDILELIAKAKLGLRGYTIINQGMGDFILSASPSQRREIFEDALGLKEFQLKKNEAKNKLELTKNNLIQDAAHPSDVGIYLHHSALTSSSVIVESCILTLSITPLKKVF